MSRFFAAAALVVACCFHEVLVQASSPSPAPSILVRSVATAYVYSSSDCSGEAANSAPNVPSGVCNSLNQGTQGYLFNCTGSTVSGRPGGVFGIPCDTSCSSCTTIPFNNGQCVTYSSASLGFNSVNVTCTVTTELVLTSQGYSGTDCDPQNLTDWNTYLSGSSQFCHSQGGNGNGSNGGGNSGGVYSLNVCSASGPGMYANCTANCASCAPESFVQLGAGVCYSNWDSSNRYLCSNVSPTQTPSQSPSRSLSQSATASPTRSPSTTETQSRSQAPTASLSVTGTPSQTMTASQSRTPTSTVSQSKTASQSSSQTKSSSRTQSQSRSQSGSQSLTPSQSVTTGLTPTATPSQTDSPSQSGSPSQSQTSTGSQSQSQSLSSTGTRSSSQTATPSVSSSASGSQTATPSETVTPSADPTPSETTSPTQDPSITSSGTRTRSQAASLSTSPTHSQSRTASESPSSSASTSATPSISPSPTRTVTPTLSTGASPSPTATVTPTQTTSLVYVVVQVGVGLQLSGVVTPAVVTTPSVGVLLRAGLACIANASLSDVIISSTTYVNGTAAPSTVNVLATDAVNTATTVGAPCAPSAARLLRGTDIGRDAAARRLDFSSSMQVNLAVSVRVAPSVSSPESSSQVTAVLSHLSPVLNATAANFSSGASQGAGGAASLAAAFTSFASAAAAATGSSAASMSVGVAPQTALVTLATPSPSPTPSSSYRVAALSPSPSSSVAVSAPSSSTSSSSLSTGAIIGIAVGGGVAFILIVVLVVVFFCRRNKSAINPVRKDRDARTAAVGSAAPASSAAGGNYDGGASGQPRAMVRANSYTDQVHAVY